MYISGQERRLVNPPSQVVAGVRTVTTKNEWALTLPRSRPFAFVCAPSFGQSGGTHPIACYNFGHIEAISA